jgi:hypothetical protein
MKATFSFSGCSCGCTPGSYITIKSDTKDGLIYGIADTALDHSVYGDNPFRKCHWKVEDGDITDQEILKMANKIREIERKISKKEEKRDKPFSPPYSTLRKDTFPLSNKQLKINEEECIKHKLAQKGWQKEIDKLKAQKSRLYKEYERESH